MSSMIFSQYATAVSVGDGGSGRFVDQIAVGEPFNGEWRVDRVRLVVRDGMREDMCRSRRCLESAGAPTAIDIQAGDRCPGNDGRAVWRHIDDPSPTAQHTKPAECWKHFT